MDRSKLPIWVQNYDVFCRCWYNRVLHSHPYNTIVEKLGLNIDNKFPWFYNPQESLDMITSCRRLCQILGIEVDYELMSADPLGYFISLVPRSFSSNQLSVLDSSMSEIAGTNKLKLVHFALVSDSYILDDIIVAGVRCSTLSQADYVSMIKYNISYSVLQKFKITLASIVTTANTYVYINKSHATIVSRKDAKSKKYFNADYNVCSNNGSLIDLFISLHGGKIIVDDGITDICGKVRKLKIKDKKIKRKIPAVVRKEVWTNCFGRSLDGSCSCCNTAIEYSNWDCGHIVSEANGGEEKCSNLRPVCRTCNLNMGTMNMDDYITIIKSYQD